MKPMTPDNAYNRFVERYTAGDLPWDDALPPPEVIDLVADLQPGRALDLGCGYGRTAIYLAQRGWQADGIDFVPQAIAEARRRAAAAGVATRARFHLASVAELGFLHDRYHLAVDVGCLHALSEEEQAAYQAGLVRLLAPGSPFLLFARLQAASEGEEGGRGLAETAVRRLFAAGFKLEDVQIGVTNAGDNAWRSGWFWFRRQAVEGS